MACHARAAPVNNLPTGGGVAEVVAIVCLFPRWPQRMAMLVLNPDVRVVDKKGAEL